MRCLLCSAIFNTNEELIQHYVSYHRVDANNRFFQKLFEQTNNSAILRKCLRCDDFITTRDYKIKHDFLKHYDEGQTNLYEDKPIDIIKLPFMTKFEISIIKHGEYYNFFNSAEVVDDFLRNVRSKFKPSVLKISKGPLLLRIFKPQLLKILLQFQIADFGVQKYIRGFILMTLFLTD